MIIGSFRYICKRVGKSYNGLKKCWKALPQKLITFEEKRRYELYRGMLLLARVTGIVKTIDDLDNRKITSSQ